MPSTTPIGVVIADTEGVIREWSPPLADLFGYTTEEAIGRKVDLIVPDALRGRHWIGFNKAVASASLERDGKPFTLVALHKNRRLVPVRAKLEFTPADDGAVSEFRGTFIRRAPAWIAPLARVLLVLPGVRKPLPSAHT